MPFVLLVKTPKNTQPKHWSITSDPAQVAPGRWVGGKSHAYIARVSQPRSVQVLAPKVLPSGFFNIAMENGPFIHGLPIKNGDFPWLC